MKRQTPSNTPVTSVPSAAVAVTEINDPTAAGEDLQVIEQDAVQLEANPLRARRIVVRLGSSVLLYQRTNLPIRTRSILRGRTVAYVAFGPRAVGTLNGLPFRPDSILISTPGVKAEFVVSANYESVSFLVAPDDVRADLLLRVRGDQSAAAHGVQLLRTGAGSRLFDCGRRVALAAAKHPEAFDDFLTISDATTELFEVLHSSLGSAVEAESTRHEGTRLAYSRVVQKAEDYALKHADEPLYTSYLCKAASVSERTLQKAFKEIVGMTPVAFLTRLRLHRVRHALRAATPHSTTVSAEARKWCFRHLGDFARDYRDCFGELPSDTLHRKHPM